MIELNEGHFALNEEEDSEEVPFLELLAEEWPKIRHNFGVPS
jgi:hypothetical protein